MSWWRKRADDQERSAEAASQQVAAVRARALGLMDEMKAAMDRLSTAVATDDVPSTTPADRRGT